MYTKYLSLFSGIGGFEKAIEEASTGKKKFQNVSDSLKSTSTQSKFTRNTSPVTETSATSQKSTKKNYPTLTSSWEVSLAKLLVLLESGEDSMILGDNCFTTLQEFCELNGHDYSSLKTLKGLLLTPMETLSERVSGRLSYWGMTCNGNLLTANITESPKTGKESSLSDILEEHPDPMYFLSEHNMEMIKKSEELYRSTNPTIQDTGAIQQTD